MADIVGDDPLRNSYIKVAEHYLLLAQAELEQLELPAVIARKQPKQLQRSQGHP